MIDSKTTDSNKNIFNLLSLIFFTGLFSHQGQAASTKVVCQLLFDHTSKGSSGLSSTSSTNGRNSVLMAVRPYLDPSVTLPKLTPVGHSTATTATTTGIKSQSDLRITSSSGNPMAVLPKYLLYFGGKLFAVARSGEFLNAILTNAGLMRKNESNLGPGHIILNALPFHGQPNKAILLASHSDPNNGKNSIRYFLTNGTAAPTLIELPNLDPHQNLFAASLRTKEDLVLVGSGRSGNPIYIINADGTSPTTLQLPSHVNLKPTAFKIDPIYLDLTGQIILPFHDQTVLFAGDLNDPSQANWSVIDRGASQIIRLSDDQVLALATPYNDTRSATNNSIAFYTNLGQQVNEVKFDNTLDYFLGAVKLEHFPKGRVLGVVNKKENPKPVEILLWNADGKELSRFDLPTTFPYAHQEGLTLDFQEAHTPIQIENGKAIVPVLSNFEYKDADGSSKYKTFLQYFLFDAHNSIAAPTQAQITVEVPPLSGRMSSVPAVVPLDGRYCLLQFHNTDGEFISILTETNGLKPLGRFEKLGPVKTVTPLGKSKVNGNPSFAVAFANLDSVVTITVP